MEKKPAKHYEVIVTISYEQENETENEKFERWLDSSTFRVTKTHRTGRLKIDSLRPNLGQQDFNEMIEEMREILFQAHRHLKLNCTKEDHKAVTDFRFNFEDLEEEGI